jgi:archaeosine-15-forming tRNA-guanine transglycosylase
VHAAHSTDQIVAAANAGKHVFCENAVDDPRRRAAGDRAVNDNKTALAVGRAASSRRSSI